MKIPLFSLVLIAGGSLSLPAQQFPPSATVRIDNNIPDGTPPPPEAPKPKFVVRSRDILKAETHLQAGRKITVNTIKPISLPSPPVIPTPVKIDDPAILKSLAEARRLPKPRLDMLRLGASIFRFQNSPPRSFVRYWPEDSANPIVFWSPSTSPYSKGWPRTSILPASRAATPFRSATCSSTATAIPKSASNPARTASPASRPARPASKSSPASPTPKLSPSSNNSTT